MQSFDIYRDIATRTDGSIYIGVVGPVRTGKSTFIRRFMDMAVLPRLSDGGDKQRIVDELPQAAQGRTVMTTQPRFVPNEAVNVELSPDVTASVRMVDCVGYMVGGAQGHMEDGSARMVRTPWFDYDIPFEQAADVGTRKVIADHSTIGVVLTTDGSITDLPRSAYIDAEERVVQELTELNKPFAIVVNSAHPEAEEARELKAALSERYAAPVSLLNVAQMDADDIDALLLDVLYEFPVTEISAELPGFVLAMDDDSEVLGEVVACLRTGSESIRTMRDCKGLAFADGEGSVRSANISALHMDTGGCAVKYEFPENLFYDILSDECGEKIEDDYHLMAMMRDLTRAKRGYDRYAAAMEEAYETGYGIIAPSIEDTALEKPELFRQGGRFGVKLNASAPSIHLVRVDVKSELSPVMGSEKQSADFAEYLRSEYSVDPASVWGINIFGRSVGELTADEMAAKMSHMPIDAREKMQATLTRIINEGSGGLICILL